MTDRICAGGCKRKITGCNGFVNAGDHLRAMAGEIPYTAIRELCGVCVEKTWLLTTEGQEFLAMLRAN